LAADERGVRPSSRQKRAAERDVLAERCDIKPRPTKTRGMTAFDGLNRLEQGTAVTINLRPETERLVQEEQQNGHFRSVDEMIVEGVQAGREEKPLSREAGRKTPAEAVAHIRELRQGNRLPAGAIKDVVNEGRV
jgi:hypothetical protein